MYGSIIRVYFESRRLLQLVKKYQTYAVILLVGIEYTNSIYYTCKTVLYISLV